MDKRRVFSVGAWSPSLRTMLNSTIEPCGCMVGVYLSWRGQTVAVIDLPNPRCVHQHRLGDVDERQSDAATPAERA